MLQWEVFSKHCKDTYRSENIRFQPVSLDNIFQDHLYACKGILCNAGFETPAEALYMGKKLCVIPIRNQYELECNAAFLAQMGIPVLPKLKNQYPQLRKWLDCTENIQIRYEHYIGEILELIIL